MSVPFAPAQLTVPEGFEDLLYAFAKEALREQPADLYRFGADYFQRCADAGGEIPKPSAAPRELPSGARVLDVHFDGFKAKDDAEAPADATNTVDQAGADTDADPAPAGEEPEAAARALATEAVEGAEAAPDTAETTERSLPGASASNPGERSLQILAAMARGDAMDEVADTISNLDKLKALWRELDYNGNNLVSLAEIDKLAVTKQWNISKPALMRAYKQTTINEGDGDAWVEKKEFKALLRNIFFMQRLYELFDDIDTGDDRRVDEGEFAAGMGKLGCTMSAEEASAEFKRIDKNGGGQILFDEFCAFIAGVAMPDVKFVDDEDHKPKGEEAAASTTASGEAVEGAESGIERLEILAALSKGDAMDEVADTINNLDKLKALWRELDYNGNNLVSLAEIDKLAVTKQWNISKPALMRAYKQTTINEGDGDAWVEKKEFKALLRNIFFMQRLYELFDDIDTGDDRRVDEGEFAAGMGKLGCTMSAEEASAEFKRIDKNGGGQILFDEFCAFIAGVAMPDVKFVDDEDHKPKGEEAEGTADNTTGSDTDPEIKTKAFDALEKEIVSSVKSKDSMEAMWKRIDYNGNGKVSLAEIDKFVVEQYPLLDHKPALMRAYKKTTKVDGDGDDWVERDEFPALLRNLFFFNRVFSVYEVMDEGNDRRLDLDEFKKGAGLVGMSLTDEEASTEFGAMDKNDGGQVLFDEFCLWVAAKKAPVE